VLTIYVVYKNISTRLLKCLSLRRWRQRLNWASREL